MHGSVQILLELGSMIFVLALLARVAMKFGFSPIPLYLIGGLVVGEGGLVPLVTSEEFVAVGAELGVILLLLMLGLEYTGEELVQSVRSTSPAGGVDLVLNFVPGYAVGLILGLGPTGSLFLGGVTYISSSGVVAKLVSDLGWIGNRETPVVLSLLVFEDLVMAVMLPVLGALALGGTFGAAALTVTAALIAVAAIITVAARHGDRISRTVFSGSDEVNLLTLLGVTLLVAGLAERLSISAAVGAFLVGIGVSGEAVIRARALLSPLRDLFAAVFFVFFGLQTDPTTLPRVALPVIILAAVTGATKVATGWWAAKRVGIGAAGRRRAGVALIARGEFSVVIAGLGLAAGVDPVLGGIAVGYVLLTATLGPLLSRFGDRDRPRSDRSTRRESPRET